MHPRYKGMLLIMMMMKDKQFLKVFSTTTSGSGLVKVEVFFLLLLLGTCCFSFVLDAAPPPPTNDQVISLLAFKHTCVRSDPNGFLNNWSSLSPTPCSWNGISCFPPPPPPNGDGDGHGPHGLVVELNLANAGLIGNLQFSDLMSLSNLATLSFHGNSFSGNLSSPKTTNQLCNFEFLDLSANNFTHPLVLDSLLLSCTRLATLNLSHNFIPSVSFKFWPKTSLSQLDLSTNRIVDSTTVNQILSNCQSLKLFNISGNTLTGSLNISLSSCNTLSILDLSHNRLSGDIPSTLLSDAPVSLEFFDLSHNNLTGYFTNFVLGNCFNLTVLNLSFNLLSANGFPSSLSNCNKLETLDLSHNALGENIPGDLLGKLKSLKHLHLANNRFSGEIPVELGSLCSTLQELDLSWNDLSGGIPLNFELCLSLSTLNLGNNQLSGDFLSTVISKLTNLQYLYLAFNNLTGSIPLSLSNCTQLKVLDLGSNNLTGNVPSVLCSNVTISVLEKLLLPNNYLTGQVPSQLGQCRNLKSIDLSFNLLTGTIPHQVWSLPHLSDLVMWANSLIGEIPQGICVNSGNLQTLILNNNFLTGDLPESLSSCTNLIWISLSSNRLTGQIPSGIGNLVNLAILQLGNNSITGAIPSGIGNCKSLIWLDLNSNNLSGLIPSEISDGSGYVQPGAVSGKKFAFVRNEGGTACRGAGGLVEFEGIRDDRLANYPMVHSCPSIRIYNGLTVYTFASNGSMIYLDLSYNTFSGSIPETLGSMSFVQVLNLGHNNLTGSIPFSFGGLKTVGVLDLSHNGLTGFIPPVLGGLSFLSDFDVSNNQLSGLIPTGGQLITFPASRYENNSGLCGLPLPPCASGNVHHSVSPNSHKRKEHMAFAVLFGIIASLFSLLLLTFALYRVQKHKKLEEDKKRDKYMDSLPTSGSSSWKLSGVLEPLSINVAAFEKPLRKLTFAHLVEATNGFSADSLIGSGGFGEVYKAQLKDGCVVAIKKLIHVTFQGDREFVAEMETIGKIKHRNLVPLLGYCKIGEERLLVYEYMKWGSLESVLHERGKGEATRLDWAARKRIAIGSARGLAFLHHSCIPHIIHRDMKSSNVLLDENREARVSDFGMARLVNAVDTHLSVSTLAGTPGYVPPEYYQSFRCTTKGDVYSYGVILMELVTGKRAIDNMEFGEDNNLVGWAKQKYREKRREEIVDQVMISASADNTDEIVQYLNIAFQCLDDKSFRRPTMIQVMSMFKEVDKEDESAGSRDTVDDDGMSSIDKDLVIEESQEKEALYYRPL